MRQNLGVNLAGIIPLWPPKTPLKLVVSEEGFEPPTPWFVATCSNPLSYRPRLHWIY
jgi:hypothetical protein